MLAYKVLQAIFRKVTLEGKPYPDTVSFSYRELGRMIGRDVFGGRDAQQLYEAIRQLEDTKIEFFLYEIFAKVGERDEVQGVRNTGGETYQPDRRASE